ncbi:DMT family transporter [Pleionea sp. CnH1-48]|uniref:DMT family transporter n=1 Tax=Pleionea sp. CnH1-48 TaxID=2954494 RepID=UPI0020970749|nr:DMT family transporter [Pleionea sp. CnH1-48]MCO7226028.1 DMT family transporter [Pleionea sp. CnH1-48]
MTENSNENVAKGMILMVVAVFFFSFMDILIKWLSAHYSSYQVAFFRGLMSLPFVLLWIMSKDAWKELKTQRLSLHLMRGGLSVLFFVCVVIGLRELTVANAYAIFFSAPLLVAVLSIFWLNEKVGIHRWASIVVGLVGVFIALNPGDGPIFTLGTVACLLSVVGYSIVVIMLKKMTETESDFSMIFYFLVSLSVGCGLLAITDWRPIVFDHWPYLLGLGFTGALGQYFITRAFVYAPASVLAPLDYTALIWGALMAYWIWSELPVANVWIGATIIILSGLYLMYRESKQHKKIETDKNLHT